MISAVEMAGLLGLPAPTDEQAAVIESELGPAVVIAGAGSGKTETMAARVVWLVANRRVAPEAVLGLTFTRKAAAELGKRIRRRLAQWRHVVEREHPDDQKHLAQLRAGEPTVSTYAAYAGRLVSEQAMRVGAEPAARLLSQALSWQLADAAVRNYSGALPVDIGAPSSLTRYLLTMSGQFADHLVDPDDVEQYCHRLLERLAVVAAGKSLPKTGSLADFATSTAHRAALVPLVRDFAAAKAARPAVDFGDQMRIAARLAEIGEVRVVERARFAAVLLDEYQDTGHAQIAMLHGLFDAGHPVTAVGDPFQSIYGWRGASAGNIARFAQTFRRADGAEATVYPLATSFRNARVILDAANALAQPLRRLDGLTIPLRAARGTGTGRIAVARVETVADEARWVAGRMRAEWDALPAGARTAAVLVRRRAQIPLLSEALQAAGLPVEVLGLGGLLTTPEVVDVAATLRVLGDHKPARSLVRLLTGARWRIGPSDLAALRSRAVSLVRVDDDPTQPEERERASIVEALDDLGPADRYSAEGYRRLAELSAELRRLRRRLSAPLAELVAEVERSIGVDVEVAARADRAAVGRTHLDRFLDEAARFAAESGETTLRAFLAFLDAAEDEENGLEAGEIVVETERVQVLTVHGAKGLEWDVVSVPGLVEKIFPAEPKSMNWTRSRHELPGPLRGDGDDLPPVCLDGAADLAEVRARLERHHDDLVERHAREERRLAYVALTRARTAVLASGFAWDHTKTQRAASPFLLELRGFAPAGEWFEAPPGAANPLSGQTLTAAWPADPLAPSGGGAGRRSAVEAGAALVRAATHEGPSGLPPAAPGAGAAPERPATHWRHDVDVLLAERARLQRGDAIEVELPRQLSVSQLVELDRDPRQLARRLHRPLPMAPAPWARRGTALHTWLEQRWKAQTLLDVDELPGAADADADDADFLALRAAFERSDWAERTPAEVEVPFEMAVDGTVVRGRMDAVFGSTDDGWLVVDWKTGKRPTGAAAQSAAVQLAAYRLAWARLCGIADADLHTVRAAFHYVRSNETVTPTDLLDAAGLRALISGPQDRGCGRAITSSA
ncbi:MAG: DNA helicase UvrD [Pseudonocardiales bacterium]|nr:MAG: DNA helicase UvrD [Pseudonocardiales bacterium]